jgi:peptidoglycan/xylan/chitin deacetylase (PgdA/CDA1 family)
MLVCKDVTAKGGIYKATGIRVTGIGCAEARNDLASWLKQGSRFLPHNGKYWHSRKIAGGKWLAEYGTKKLRPTITFMIQAIPVPTPKPTANPPAPTPTPAPSAPAPAPDTQAPAITLDSPSDGARYNVGQTVIAHFSCTDNVAVAKCSGTVPDGAAIATDKPGSQSFAVTAVDTAGNTIAKTVVYSVGDATPPAVLISSPFAGRQVEAGATLVASFSCKDNVDVTTCYGTSSDNQIIFNNETIPTNLPGPQKFAVTATDSSGNVTTASVSYTVVDTTPPQITITSPTTGANYSWGQKAAYTCSDTVKVASCTADVGGMIPVANNTALPASGVPTAGQSTFTVTATDAAGNRATKMVSPYLVQPLGQYALTFHDGPNPQYTPQVLTNLASVNAHATFFLIGVNAQANAGLAKAIVNAGMQVGNHTMNHRDIGSPFNNPFYQSQYALPFGDSATKEITDGKNAIMAATGVTTPPKWFEPPFGDYGTDSTVQGLVAAAGETLCAWTVDSTDSLDTVPPFTTIVDRVVNGWSDKDGTYPGVAAGGIIEMHDASAETAASVVPIVTQLASKGLLPGEIRAYPTGFPGPFGSPQPAFYCTAGPWS